MSLVSAVVKASASEKNDTILVFACCVNTGSKAMAEMYIDTKRTPTQNETNTRNKNKNMK